MSGGNRLTVSYPGTGTLRLDGRFKRLNRDANLGQAVGDLAERFQYEPAALLSASRKSIEPASFLVDCLRPGSIPISMPVAMEVVDQKGDIATFFYFLIVGIPLDHVAKAISMRAETWKN